MVILIDDFSGMLAFSPVNEHIVLTKPVDQVPDMPQDFRGALVKPEQTPRVEGVVFWNGKIIVKPNQRFAHRFLKPGLNCPFIFQPSNSFENT